MNLFKFFNKETKEGDNPEKKNSETKETTEPQEKDYQKLESHEPSKRDKFMESIKFNGNNSDESGKLEGKNKKTENNEDSDSERGDFERSKVGGKDEGR